MGIRRLDHGFLGWIGLRRPHAVFLIRLYMLW